MRSQTPASPIPDFAAHCEQLRWSGHPRCPKCGSTRVTRLKNPATAAPHQVAGHHCKACRRRFSLTTGTVLHASHIPLATWERAFHAFFAPPKPPSAPALQRQLELAPGTARRIVQVLRSLAPYCGGNPERALRLALSIHPSRRFPVSTQTPTQMPIPMPLAPTTPPRAAGDSFVAKAVILLDSALDGLHPSASDWDDRTVFLNRLSRSLRDVGHFVQAMTAPNPQPNSSPTEPLPTPSYWPTETVEEWNARQARAAESPAESKAAA